jgi:hypothetical protein
MIFFVIILVIKKIDDNSSIYNQKKKIPFQSGDPHAMPEHINRMKS